MSKKNSKKNVEWVPAEENQVIEAAAQVNAENQKIAERLRTAEENRRTAELEARIAELEARLAAAPRAHGSQRREQILTALRNGPMSIKALAMELSTPENPVSVRNVSSILTGIRKAGYVLHTDEQSRKYLVSEPAVEKHSMVVDDEAVEREYAAEQAEEDFN